MLWPPLCLVCGQVSWPLPLLAFLRAFRIVPWTPHRPVCCQVSRPPCMVVYQVEPLPTHRPVRQEGFWPPLLLACQTMCRPVSRPPHHPGCREVSPLFPLLACQPPFWVVLRSTHHPVCPKVSRPRHLLACPAACELVPRLPTLLAWKPVSSVSAPTTPSVSQTALVSVYVRDSPEWWPMLWPPQRPVCRQVCQPLTKYKHAWSVNGTTINFSY